MYRKYAGTILQRADESFEAVVYASYTFRRLDLYASTVTSSTPEDLSSLENLMQKIRKEIGNVSLGFSEVAMAIRDVSYYVSGLYRHEDHAHGMLEAFSRYQVIHPH